MAVVIIIIAISAIGTFTLIRGDALRMYDSPTPSSLMNGSLSNSQKSPAAVKFKLDVIGVPSSDSVSGNNSKSLYVPLEGNCKINVTIGSFMLNDNDCLRGNRASISIIHPNIRRKGTSNYSVWVKLVSMPDPSKMVTNCDQDVAAGEYICALQSYISVNPKEKSSFHGLSKGFLQVNLKQNNLSDSSSPKLSVFDEGFKDYFWKLDNNGWKVLQLRFYLE